MGISVHCLTFTDLEFVMWDLKGNTEVLNHIDLDNIRNTEEDDGCGTQD